MAFVGWGAFLRTVGDMVDRTEAASPVLATFIRAIIIAAFVCSSLVAREAAAQTTAYAAGQGGYSPNDLTVTIPVIASVGGRCGFVTAPSGSHNEPNFDDHAWQQDFAFQLDCTGAFRLAVLSSNGGLRTSGVVPTGYSTLAPYNVALHVVGNASTLDSPTCSAGTLTSGSTCPYVGTASNATGFYHAGPSTLQSGSYVRVSAPPYTGAETLISGNYADTLTVTVSVAL